MLWFALLGRSLCYSPPLTSLHGPSWFRSQKPKPLILSLLLKAQLLAFSEQPLGILDPVDRWASLLKGLSAETASQKVPGLSDLSKG